MALDPRQHDRFSQLSPLKRFDRRFYLIFGGLGLTLVSAFLLTNYGGSVSPLINQAMWYGLFAGIWSAMFFLLTYILRNSTDAAPQQLRKVHACMEAWLSKEV